MKLFKVWIKEDRFQDIDVEAKSKAKALYKVKEAIYKYKSTHESEVRISDSNWTPSDFTIIDAEEVS